jgi:hypothetical protein
MSKRTLVERGVRRLCLAVALAFPVASVTFPAAASAQTAAAATVSGTIVDASGRPIGGARVTIASATVSRVVRANPDGTFSATVPPDTYSVTATLAGFQSTTQDGVTVTPGAASALRIALPNATLTTIGTINTSTQRQTALNTTTAATATVNAQTFLDQGQLQVTNVLDQIPGVEINRDSSNSPGANTSISIRGAQPYESQVLIDGHPVVTSANGANGFNSTFINSLLLGDIQVDKGPGSLPNTIEDAVGGTLNFRTPSITGGPTGSFVGGADSFFGSYFGIKASDTFGKLGVLVGYAENETPGYLPPGAIAYGGQVAPSVGPGQAYDPHVGAVDFTYPASQNFGSRSQLFKLAYNFSPETSIQFTSYSTQTNLDETGTNFESVNALVVPCYDTAATSVATSACTAATKKPNYTSTPNLGYVGQTLPIDLYGTYPNTSGFDNEPIFSGEFRTVVGPGSLLARYYTGAINRVITQNFAANAVEPCATPACPNGDVFTPGQLPVYNAYNGEPYVEDTIDILHGFDAQYTVPFGANTVTAGFDRHVDTATFGEYDPTLGPPTFTQGLNIQSIAYSLRGTFALTPKLTLSSGNYLSSTSYVGTRFDPRDGLAYRVNRSAVVRASYGSAYVAPYYGLINTAPYVSGGVLNLATSTFKPETSSGYDIGTDINVARDTLFSFDGYLTNIFNRYTSVTAETAGTLGNRAYTEISQNGNQAVVREEGLELQLTHAPRIGLGFHSAVDLLRDYAYNQNPADSTDSIFSATPDNYVQLPGYPYTKIRNDLFYTFGNGALVRFSGTSYGENNAFGEPGFTEFDAQIRLPLPEKVFVNIGGTNIFNHDNYEIGGVYNGGPTFNTLGGGTSYTTQFPTQPRTLYIELQRSVGPGGDPSPQRNSSY